MVSQRAVAPKPAATIENRRPTEAPQIDPFDPRAEGLSARYNLHGPVSLACHSVRPANRTTAATTSPGASRDRK